MRKFALRKIGVVTAGLGLGLALGAQTQAQDPENVIRAMPGNRFDRPMLVIQAGESVTWMNGGGFHNVVADDGSFRCSTGCDQNGGSGNPSTEPWSFTLTFTEPGTVPYFCEVHGGEGGRGMSGTIVVQDPNAEGL